MSQELTTKLQGFEWITMNEIKRSPVLPENKELIKDGWYYNADEDKYERWGVSGMSGRRLIGSVSATLMANLPCPGRVLDDIEDNALRFRLLGIESPPEYHE